jgi:hypothetical protein
MSTTFTPEQIALFQRVLARQRDVEAHLCHLERIDAAKYIVNGRRCIRIRPEPADRSLEEETAANEENRAYHDRREQEEITLQERRRDAHSRRTKMQAEAKVEKLHWYGAENATIEAKIAAIRQKAEEDIASFFFYINHRIEMIIAKRKALSWTCPNDGRAYEFEWENQRFLRTYSGEIWRDAAPMVGDEPHDIPVLGQWCGQWTGYYITSAPLIMKEPAVGVVPRQ